MLKVTSATITDLVGYKALPTEWFTIDQERVNAFADCTQDHQFIHTDPNRASSTPYGGTIAHGMLTLSLIGHFAKSFLVEIEDMEIGINYGFNQVRFLSPVKVGSRIRARSEVKSVIKKNDGQFLVSHNITIEIEGQGTPALVTEWLLLLITKS